MKLSVVMSHMNRPSLPEAVISVRDADEIILVEDNQQQRRELTAIFNDGVAQTTGDVIVITGERQVFVPEWRAVVTELVESLNGSGVVSFFPSTPGGGAVTRDFLLNELGGFMFWPDYIHYFSDAEIGERARMANKYAECSRERIFSRVLDKVGRSEDTELYRIDQATFEARKLLGFPNRRLIPDELRQAYLNQL